MGSGCRVGGKRSRCRIRHIPFAIGLKGTWMAKTRLPLRLDAALARDKAVSAVGAIGCDWVRGWITLEKCMPTLVPETESGSDLSCGVRACRSARDMSPGETFVMQWVNIAARALCI